LTRLVLPPLPPRNVCPKCDSHRTRIVGQSGKPPLVPVALGVALFHATLAVLCDSGFLLRDPVHRTYVLGPGGAATE